MRTHQLSQSRSMKIQRQNKKESGSRTNRASLGDTNEEELGVGSEAELRELVELLNHGVQVDGTFLRDIRIAKYVPIYTLIIQMSKREGNQKRKRARR